ncbi:MAG TPA: coenzyme F420-0:L-glutamate ligase [Candidatus Bathyarchaeia archaeon]|nr:coenzyme F420-0:L-glutamate ligase [Candidatus Bathyarchaeia archaeon]
METPVEIVPVRRLPLLKSGDDLALLLIASLKRQGTSMRNGDVLVIGQKAVSKVEGRVVDIDKVKPSREATRLSKSTKKRPEFIQVVLNDAKKVLKADENAFIVLTRNGSVCLNGGADKSNIKGDSMYALLPHDSDGSARRLRDRIGKITGKVVGVIISDTRSRPFRLGQVEEAIGVAGLKPLVDYRGQSDLFGYQLQFKNVNVADELASAAELVMGQGREMTPAALIRGLPRITIGGRGSSKDLTVSASEDLFGGTLP